MYERFKLGDKKFDTLDAKKETLFYASALGDIETVRELFSLYPELNEQSILDAALMHTVRGFAEK